MAPEINIPIESAEWDRLDQWRYTVPFIEEFKTSLGLCKMYHVGEDTLSLIYHEKGIKILCTGRVADKLKLENLIPIASS
ncbi:MAG TPA: hypothetical protein VIK81_01210 [Patescibacteria group bacterium]